VALMERLGLPSGVQRVPQHHLGDHGGLRCVALAAQIARGNPAARVLVVYGDVWSMLGAFMPTPIAAEDLRSVALYTDGAAGKLSLLTRCVFALFRTVALAC
jgi:predicted naringenin-chalcone synthase